MLGSRTIDINYNASNRVSQFRDTGAGGAWQTVGHDARGNVTALGALGFVYDAANQPTSVSGSATAAYVYDGNLKRVKTTEGGAATYSVYSSLTGKVSLLDNQTAGDRIVLLNLGPVSVRVPASGAVVYTHLDHLGGPVAATNTSGGVLWRESYNPYGEKRTDPAANRNKPGFTGHVDDDATGLTYMQARYYSPVLGRFLSNDPVGFTPGRPDMFNRYAYAANDPVNMIDPAGLQAHPVHLLNSEQRERYAEVMVDVEAYRAQQDGSDLINLVPLLGDIKGIAEAIADPSLVNVVAAGVGLLPGVGDIAGAGLKGAARSVDSASGTGRGKNRLAPNPNARGPHSTYKTDTDGRTSNYATYEPNPRNPSGFDEVKRVDVTGRSHRNPDGTIVPTPHVREQGTKGVRPARPEELP